MTYLIFVTSVDGIPTMKQFLDEVAKEIPTKWREFGNELGIAQDSLDTLERKHAGRDSQQCFAEIFSIWEKEREKPTSHLKACNWSSVVYILETETLSSRKLATVIREKFLTHDEGTSNSNEMENAIGFSISPSNFEFDVVDQPYSLPSRLQPIENRVRVTLSPDIPTLSTKPLNTQQNVSSNRLPLSSIRPLVGSNVLPSPYSPYDQAQNISSTSILPIFSTSVTNSTVVPTTQMHQPPYTNTFIPPHLYQSPYSIDPRHYFPHSHTGLESSINPYTNIPLHGRSNLSSGMYTQNMSGQLLPSAQQLMKPHQTGYPYNPPPLHPLQPDGCFPQTHDQVSLLSRSGVTSLEPSHMGSHLSMGGDPRFMQNFPPHVQFQNIQPQFVQQQIQTTVPSTHHAVTVINPEQISLNSDEAYASLSQQRSLTTSDDVSSVSTQHNQVMSTYGSNRNVEMVHSALVINIEKSSDASFHSATDVPPVVKRKASRKCLWVEIYI